MISKKLMFAAGLILFLVVLIFALAFWTDAKNAIWSGIEPLISG
jgi:hypothetical protein